MTKTLLRITIVAAAVAASAAAAGSAAASEATLQPSASWRNAHAQTQQHQPRAHWNGKFVG